MSKDIPDRIAARHGASAQGVAPMPRIVASAGYHSCDGYFSGVSLTPARAHPGTSGAPNPCDDLPAREAGLARRRRQSLPSDRHPARLPGHMGWRPGRSCRERARTAALRCRRSEQEV